MQQNRRYGIFFKPERVWLFYSQKIITFVIESNSHVPNCINPPHNDMKSIIPIILLSLILSCCSRTGHYGHTLTVAESLIETAPDSALAIIEIIDTDKLSGDAEKARYALLKSMALDKNYIDTTEFNVIQPAIDYYSKYGTGDEKMRTLYYEGRIHQNRGEAEEALNSFRHALEETAVTDTFTLARVHIAESVILYENYDAKGSVESSLKAADLYKLTKDTDKELGALSKAMSGCLILEDKKRADSIVEIMRLLSKSNEEYQDMILPDMFNYTHTFGNDGDIRKLIDEAEEHEDLSDLLKLNISECYLRLGETEKALEYLEAIRHDGSVQPMGYLATKFAVLEQTGNYKEALETYMEFADSMDSRVAATYERNQSLNITRHRLEVEALKAASIHQRIFWACACAILLSLLLCGYIYYRSRRAHALRVIAENEKKLAEIELERHKLGAENMTMRIGMLEDECTHLKEILHSREELSKPIETAIKERIEILNAILARDITTNDGYAKPYNEWIEKMVKDKNRFMDSTRLAFKASHPAFIEYLEDHGLSEAEVNYLCLYAIGFVSVSVPISGWWGGSHSIKKQKLQVESAENQLADSSELLVIAMQKAWTDLQDAYKQILIARNSIEQSTENLRLNENYYHAGTTTMSDLLEAQTLFQQSRDKYIETYAQFQIKTVEYLLATGR